MTTELSPRILPSDELARIVIEHAVDGLIVIDADGFIQFANPAAIALFARRTNSLVGFHIGTPAIHEPVELILPGPEYNRYVEMGAAEIVWAGRTASLASLRDISAHKQAEETLRATAESLLARNTELMRFNRAAVGRELRMIELKEEVNALCTKAGEPPRYRRSIDTEADPVSTTSVYTPALPLSAAHGIHGSPVRSTAPPIASPFSAEALFQQYLEGLLAGDRQQCRVVFQKWIQSDTPLGELYQNLVQRSLYEVGQLWAQGKISLAAEHMATAITESLLDLAHPRLFAGSRSGKSALIACAPNEFHQIGGRIVADYFELNGWRSLFLGANTPLCDLLAFIAEKRPDVIALSATMPSNLQTIIDMAIEIRAASPALPILMGGQLFRQVGRDRVERLPGVQVITSLTDLEGWIRDGEHSF